jgi:hypothetical protein
MLNVVMLTLGALVTVLGFSIAAFSLFFLSRGERLPAGDGQPQRLKYRDFELTTDRVGLLVFVGVAAMVLPLVSFVYLSKINDPKLQECSRSQKELTDKLTAMTQDMESQNRMIAKIPVSFMVRIEGKNHEDKLPTNIKGRMLREDADGTRSDVCTEEHIVNREFTCRTLLHDIRSRFLFRAKVPNSDREAGQAVITPMEPMVTVEVEKQP